MYRRHLLSALALAFVGTPLAACAGATPQTASPTPPTAPTPTSAVTLAPTATATKPPAVPTPLASPTVPIVPTAVATKSAGAPTAIASSTPGAGGAQVFKSGLARVISPSVPAADLTALASDNAGFAFDLYQAIRGQSGNLFYSPYSISLALAMAYAGASGQTAEQLARMLHYTLPQDRLHPAFNALDQQLASRGAGAKGSDGKGFRLNVANSTWGQTGYTFLQAYLDTLARNYGAGLQTLDFAASPDPSRVTINNWVKDATEGKILDLIPPGAVDALTRLVLVNTIYFNAAWKHQFASPDGVAKPWNMLDGSKVNVVLMPLTASFPYAQGDGYQALEMPYDGDELGMVVLLPDLGKLAAFEQSLTAARVQSILKALAPNSVDLQMPKFKFGSQFGLAATLKGMGATDAFDPSKADFSGMDGKRDLSVTDVIHKAIVEVNDKGTEAAAATAVIAGITSMPATSVSFVVDRPFVFLIRDVKTGAIVFVGRVVNPLA